MDERDVEMERAEGAARAVTTPEKPDAAVEDEPGAATGLVLGEESANGGVAGGEEPLQGGETAGGEEPAWGRTVADGEGLRQDGVAGGVKESAAGVDGVTQCDDVGAEKPTSVGCDAGTGKPAWVGSAVGLKEPKQGAVATGEMGIKEAVIEDRGSEAEWKRRAEGYALRAVFSEARAAASAMGVPEDRLDQVARLSDLSGIDPEDGKAWGRIGDAVQAVLREQPELRGGVGTGQATAPRRPRRDAFERGFLGA